MYNNIYTPIQHIRKPAVRPGGYCWVVFTPFENIENWPGIDPVTGISSGNLTLKAGATWYEFKVPDSNRFFNEAMKVDEAGHYWEQSVTGYIGGNNSNQTLNAGTLPFHQYAVLVKDRDGQIRLIGNRDRGADVELNYTSGDFDSSRRWNYTFKWAHTNPATIYNGSIDGILDDVIAPPVEGGDFSDDFNNDFNI